MFCQNKKTFGKNGWETFLVRVWTMWTSHIRVLCVVWNVVVFVGTNPERRVHVWYPGKGNPDPLIGCDQILTCYGRHADTYQLLQDVNFVFVSLSLLCCWEKFPEDKLAALSHSSGKLLQKRRLLQTEHQQVLVVPSKKPPAMIENGRECAPKVKNYNGSHPISCTRVPS